MRPYKNYSSSSLLEKCRISSSSNKCTECVRRGYIYNLALFSLARQARIKKQRKDKSREAKVALAKFTYLQAKVESLERKKKKIVTSEL